MERVKTLVIAALLAALAGSIALAATGGSAEVRINARQMEDGRVEFALQQRVGGEWQERILPRSRYFPAGSDGRWLNSSPLTVSAAESEAPVARGSYTPQRVAEGWNDDNTIGWGTAATSDGLRSLLIVTGETDDGTFDEAILYIACNHDDPDAKVFAFVRTFYSFSYSEPTWHSSFDSDRIGNWRLGTTYDPQSIKGDTARISDVAAYIAHDSLLGSAQALGWLSVTIPTYGSQWNTAWFDLGGAWGTPIQRNLENCGR